MKETKAMKYNLKNKLRNLACVSLLTGGMWGLSACSDYLDVVPDNVGTIEHSFSNRNEAEKYLFTCYSYIPEYHSERANVGLMGGDELATFYPIQSGDDYATFHCTRHSFGSLHVEMGTDMAVIQAYLGHKNITTTQIYSKMAAQQMCDVVDKITLKRKEA